MRDGDRSIWLYRSAAVGATMSVLIPIAIASCSEADLHAADAVFTATVTLGNETTLIVDSVLPLVMQGNRRITEVLIDARATITASTSTLARRLADDFSVQIERESPTTLRLVLPRPDRGAIGGTFKVTLPAEMHIGVFERSGTVDILNVAGQMEVNSLGHAKIVQATNSAKINVERGNALIDTTLPQGSTTDVRVGNGDIQLTIPAGISATFDVVVVGEGEIIASHPRLPTNLSGRQSFRTTVAGGLSIVRLSTGNGRIVIRTP
jgi:hypothetical protein